MKSATKSALSDLDSMWSALDAAKAEHCGEVIARPAESFTVREFAQRYNFSESHSANVLSDMVRRGKLTMQRAYIPSLAGRNQPTNVYMVAK